jgi:hypothetical protein
MASTRSTKNGYVHERAAGDAKIARRACRETLAKRA